MQDITHINDIIDRKQKNLEAIFDAVPVAMLLIDSDLTVTRVNHATRKMVNKEYLEIINKPLADIFIFQNNSEQDQGKHTFESIVKSVLDSQDPVHDIEMHPELIIDNRKMNPWLSISAQPVDIDCCQYIVLAINDITERKLAERKMKETMALKAQFISTVSHELRTPLAAMKEAVDIVYDGITGKLNKKQKDFLNIAQRNVQRLGRLINDVLDFQKLGAGKMTCHLVPGAIKEVIEDACSAMKPSADKEKIKLIIDLKPDLPKVNFDYDRIIQVLTNLLSNAIKFTGKKGKVTVSAFSSGDQILISVTDTGFGIPKEDLPKIFEQFYRVKTPGKEIQGTGLGLPIVSKIVELHNGRIDVQSQIEQGTTFTIYLPASDLSGQSDQLIENTID